MALFGKGRRIEGPVQLLANDRTPIGDPPADPKAPPPASESPPADAKPRPAEAGKEETKTPEKRNSMATRNNRKLKQQTRSSKPPSEEAVLSRARRIAKKELKKFATALGMEEYDEEAVNARLDEMVKAREENQSVLERTEGRAKTLEEQNGELRAKNAQLTQDLTRARKELEAAKQELDDFQVESEIEKAAVSAGFRDSDYGIELFRRWASTQPEDADLDPAAYFEELKSDQSKRFLFVEETVTAGPKPGTQAAPHNPQQPGQPGQGQQTQQPPGQQGATQGQGNIPPQGAPSPAGGQPDGQPKNVLDMNPREFAEHTRNTYGYSPGRA